MQTSSRRKMTIHLTPGTIGVKATQPEIVELAHYYGFEAVEPQVDYLAALSDEDLRKLRDQMGARNLVWGAAGLRVDFRTSDEAFETGMKRLPADAKALQRAGVTRVGTWMRPTHESWTYRKHFDTYATRLGKIADVYRDHGMRLGLEYVGPKLSWSAQKHPFIHTMAETKELLAAMGRPNVGFVLDSWHWYTAQESVEDLKTLKNSDVVTVDLNDAPAGLKVEEQLDLQRELPCATGVIDVAAFLKALQAIGYDGPVRPEPFNAALRAMPKEQALAATIAAMKKAFESIGS